MRNAILVMGLILTVAPLSITAGGQAAPTAPSRETELWESARKGDAAAVRRLLDAGVDPNTRFRYDATALSYACDRGHVEVVRLLLERGAKVNVKDTFYGATPLSWAISPAQGRTPAHDEVVRLLVASGADGLAAGAFQAAGGGLVVALGVILDRLKPDETLLTDLLDWARQQKQADTAARLEAAGAKPSGAAPTVDPKALTVYTGTYVDASGAEMVVKMDGTVLSLTTTRPPGRTVPLTPLAPHVFRMNGMAATRVTFTLGVAPTPATIAVAQFGEVVVGTRAGDPR